VLGAIIGGVFFGARRPASSPSAVADNSIAVLPFVDMSHAKARGYFSDGISEELLNLLSKILQLKVAVADALLRRRQRHEFVWVA
jgi:TolB-like protein